MKSYAYYPGCSAKTTCSELSVSMKKVAAHLELDLHELTSASCTGSRQIRIANRQLFLTLNARIMAMAEALSLPLMTICNTCTLNFLDVKKILDEDREAFAVVNQKLSEFGLTYRGTCKITHFLWVLIEDIGEETLRSLVCRPLKGLRVGAFYGCHVVRPPAHFGFVDSRNIKSIELINDILGCDSVDYSGRTECCGFHTAATHEKTAIKLAGRHIKSAKDNGADAIVTPCPLCHTVLDTFQTRMEADLNTKLDVPILHLPQLVGLAIGIEPNELALKNHLVRPDKMLTKIQ